MPYGLYAAPAPTVVMAELTPAPILNLQALHHTSRRIHRHRLIARLCCGKAVRHDVRNNLND